MSLIPDPVADFFSANRWIVIGAAIALGLAVLCTPSYCAGRAGETVRQQDGTIKVQAQTIQADGNAADARAPTRCESRTNNGRSKMPFRTPRAWMMLAVLAGAPSCGSRVVVQPQLPPVADLKQIAEPPYPVAALQPGDTGAKAEAAWVNQVLTWGRTGWTQNRRVCQWAVDMKLAVPARYCTSSLPLS